MASLFADSSIDLSFQIAPSIALDHSVVVTQYKSSTPDLPAENHAFFRRDLFENLPPTKVALIAIGGTGHSPYPEAYIGRGMLASAVTGAIFMAPSPEAIRSTLEFVANRARGILVVGVNHRNDENNVTEAIEGFKKLGSLCPVEQVVVRDEAEARKARYPRGLAGVLFVVKLAGALAETGGSLKEVYYIALKAAASVVTSAAASVTCSSVGRDVEMFRQPRVQLGVGVHGEPSEEEDESMLSSKNPLPIVENLFDRMHKTLIQKLEHIQHRGEGLVLMLNNLGCMSPTEMLVARHAVLTVATKRNTIFNIENGTSLPMEIYSGCFLSSLGAIGFSVSGLAIWDQQCIELLHYDTNAVGWKAASCIEICSHTELPLTPDFSHFERVLPAQRERGLERGHEPSLNNDFPWNISREGNSMTVESRKSAPERCVLAVADALLTEADKINELDRRHGNGSLGVDAIRLSKALTNPNNLSDYAELAKKDPVDILNRIAEKANVAMQGSFRKSIQVFLSKMASFLRWRQGENLSWKDAFAHTVLSMKTARPESPQALDRTMMAALEPAAQRLRQQNVSLADVCAAAWSGCRGTKDARSSASQLGFEDAGAWFVCTCLDAIRTVFEPRDDQHAI